MRTEEVMQTEYVQKSLTYTVHAFDDHFYVVDPFGQQSENKPIDRLEPLLSSFVGMLIDYNLVDHRTGGLEG